MLCRHRRSFQAFSRFGSVVFGKSFLYTASHSRGSSAAPSGIDAQKAPDSERGCLGMRLLKGLLPAVLTIVSAASLPAQSIYGTLTGIVSDPSQSVVAGAAIKLVDQLSGSQRDTVTNSDGY